MPWVLPRTVSSVATKLERSSLAALWTETVTQLHLYKGYTTAIALTQLYGTAWESQGTAHKLYHEVIQNIIAMVTKTMQVKKA